MQSSERRKNKRTKRSCTVQIKPLQHYGQASGQSKWDTVMMKDISMSGMLFSYTKKLLLGTTLEFKISLPSNVEPIHCIGQVCRVDDRQASKISTAQIAVYSIAVFFKGLNVYQQVALQKLSGG